MAETVRVKGGTVDFVGGIYGEDIYLVGVSEGSCVLQIVREPWRYFALAGVIMMLAGAFLLFVNGPNKR